MMHSDDFMKVMPQWMEVRVDVGVGVVAAVPMRLLTHAPSLQYLP
jgi:hypothetical protein